MLSSHNNFGAPIDRTLKKIRSTIIRSFRENEIDLTPEQWTVLSMLDQKDGQSQKELADGSFKDAPTTSRILDLLIKKDFLKKQEVEDNRRQYQIFISKKGRAIVRKAKPLIEDLRIRGWKGLSNTDYKNLISILDKVFENYSELEKEK